MTETEKVLRELIALPSVNPAFLPDKHPFAGEGRVAEFLANQAAKAGLDVELQEVFPGRSNLLARLVPAGGRSRQRILLAPHLDTVNAEPTLFTPRRAGNRLFGRGACDTKGSVAAMFTALCQLSKSRTRPKETEIVFAGLVDEENGQRGSRALAAAGFRADLAIVGEPTRLEVVTAHKGSLWLQFETRGKAAHGARPELGRNAVHRMAQIVDLLETTYAAQLKRRRHRLLGSPTVSVGVISGGTQANIVPDRCTILVDRRTLPGESEGSVAREIFGLLRKRQLRASLGDERGGSCLPLETDGRLPLVRQLLACAGKRKPAGVDYFCDASVLSHAGIPSIVFGPGDIRQAHTGDEWIAVPSLERATGILKKFLEGLA